MGGINSIANVIPTGKLMGSAGGGPKINDEDKEQQAPRKKPAKEDEKNVLKDKITSTKKGEKSTRSRKRPNENRQEVFGSQANFHNTMPLTNKSKKDEGEQKKVVGGNRRKKEEDKEKHQETGGRKEKKRKTRPKRTNNRDPVEVRETKEDKQNSERKSQEEAPLKDQEIKKEKDVKKKTKKPANKPVTTTETRKTNAQKTYEVINLSSDDEQETVPTTVSGDENKESESHEVKKIKTEDNISSQEINDQDSI